MKQILEGMRVVESSAFVAVPLAGMSLAQMGAEVIRIDRLEGGMDAKRWPVAANGQSLFWAGLNKGKKSVAVDMRTAEGRELITRIATAPGPDAGLLITNIRVKGWLDYETLCQHRSDMITVTLTGDRHGNPAVDYSVNPSLGVPDMTGPEDSAEPVAHVVPCWDLIAGNMVVSSLLAAERQRLRRGYGQDVTLALKDVAAAALGHLGMIAEAALNGASRAKAGNGLFGAYGQDFLCADGQRVMVIGLTDRQWQGLVKATDTVDQMAGLEQRHGLSLREEGNRWTLRKEITAVLKPWFAKRAVSEFAGTFDQAGMTWSVFRTLDKALESDPDLGPDNPMFEVLDHAGLGAFPVPRNPAVFSAQARGAAAKAPMLGADTEQVLGDVVRMDDREIATLFDRGIVQSPGWSKTRSAA